MAILLPIPHHRFLRCLFTLNQGTTSARHSRGLRSTTSQTRDPVWLATFETALLEKNASIVLRTWEKTLRGGINLFTASDYSQELPLAYSSVDEIPELNGAAWDGLASIVGLSGGGDQIDVSNIPPNYQFKAGDRMSLIEDDRHGYYEITSDVVASVSGVAALTVEPFIHTKIFSPAAVCNFLKPVCKFRMEPESFSADATNIATPITFDAVQVI